MSRVNASLLCRSLDFPAIGPFKGGAYLGSAPRKLAPKLKIEDSWYIAKVPSGFPVGFSLLPDGERQYIAYYNEMRNQNTKKNVTTLNQDLTG